MPLNLPTFQPGQVPTAAPVQPFRPPQVATADPAQLIMQAAQMKQQNKLAEEGMAQRNIETLTNAIQTSQSLKQQSIKAQQEHEIAQRTLDMQQPGAQAETRLKNLQADALSKGIGAPYYSVKQAAQMIAGPDGTAQQIQNITDKLNIAWPQGVVDKQYADQFAMNNRFSMGQTLKSQEFNQKIQNQVGTDWQTFSNSRTVPGRAEASLGRLATYQRLLQDPNMSQDTAELVSKGIQEVLLGANGDEGKAQNQLFGTAVSRYNNVIKEITSNPQNAAQPAIKAELSKLLTETQATAQQQLNGALLAHRVSHAAAAMQDPAWYSNWENGIRSLAMGQSPQASNATQQTPPQQQPGMINRGVNFLLNKAGASNPSQPALQQPSGWSYVGPAQ